MLRSARLLAGPWSIAALFLFACGGDPGEGAASPQPLESAVGDRRVGAGSEDDPGPLSIDPILKPVKGPYTAEALAAEVQDRLTELADRLLVRDVEGIQAILHPRFRGHDFASLALGPAEGLPLGATRQVLEVVHPRGGSASVWLEALSLRVGPLARVTHSKWELVEAQFDDAEVAAARAVVEVEVTLAGETSSGELIADRLRTNLELERVDDAWRLQTLVVNHGVRLVRSGRALVEVSRSAGVHYAGPRYGQPGNDQEGWHGAAVSDLDQDGHLDLIVPGPERLFLYRNNGEGSFREEAKERGLGECAGATAPVLADFDADGDPDLVLGGLGWSRRTQQGGVPLRLFENDGTGRFTEATGEAGLGRNMPTLGLTVADLDGDGFLDLYVSGYGRLEAQANDNWLEATNGWPDRLLLGQGDLTFRDATRESGLRDSDWTVGALPVDADRDGVLDLVTLNHFGPARAWRGLGGGRFELAPGLLGGLDSRLTFGGLVADLDRDGALDLYLSGATSGTGRRMIERIARVSNGEPLASIGSMAAGNVVLRGTAEGLQPQADTGAEQAGWSWGTAATDLDLDGNLDLLSVNGFVTGDLPDDT